MYGGERLIPAPKVTVTKTYQSTGDGTKIGSEWQITINGTIVAWKGSPNSSGVLWTAGGFPPDETLTENQMLGSIIRKQEAIRTLFSVDGKQLEFQSEDGSAPMKCNPKITSIIFSEGEWFQRNEYSITATCSNLSVNGLALGEDSFASAIETANETWGIETNEEPESKDLPRTYRVTHTLSAKGKRIYNSDGSLQREAWEQGRMWVQPKMGWSATLLPSSGVQDLPAFYNQYNHLRTENIDSREGVYSITEVWLLASGNALENFDINISNSIDTQLTKVNIDGTITGLEVRDANMNLVSKKYDNAYSKWTAISGMLLSRAQTYSNCTLNIRPLSSQITESINGGFIKYNYEFDNRASNYLSDSYLEHVTVSDNLPTDFCVPIFVLGRAKGPVLQNLNTSKERIRTINVELVMPVPTGNVVAALAANPGTRSDVISLIDAGAPQGNVTSYVQDWQQSWDCKNGRYTSNKTWIWEPN